MKYSIALILWTVTILATTATMARFDQKGVINRLLYVPESNSALIANTEGKDVSEIIVDKRRLDEQWKQKIYAKNSRQLKTESSDKAKAAIPEAINMDMMFFPQAPEGDWSMPWKEACEEASIILAAYYVQDKSLDIGQFKSDILALTKLQEEMFGSAVDTTIEQTQELYNTYFTKAKTKVIDNPTIEQIKSELAQWNPVVAPFAGRELGNSNFTYGWPRYHMLVIKWYDEKYFYAHDVGTKFGKDFPYSYSTIMSAFHDFVPIPWNIGIGEKRILVILN